MIRRLLALALWGYFAWYLAAMLAIAVGGPSVAGPIAAALTVALGVIGWARRHGNAQRHRPSRELQASR